MVYPQFTFNVYLQGTATESTEGEIVEAANGVSIQGGAQMEVIALRYSTVKNWSQIMVSYLYKCEYKLN
jgi:hypothetical protein